MASATLKSKSNLNEFVPGFFTPCKKPQRMSTWYGCSSEKSMFSFASLGILASESNYNSEIVPVFDQDLFQEIFPDTSKQSILRKKSFLPITFQNQAKWH